MRRARALAANLSENSYMPSRAGEFHFQKALTLPFEPQCIPYPQVFAPKCALPVREAEDKVRAEPGTVYFAPPDYHLLLDKGPQLALSIDELVHFSRPSIDVLFESAADVYADRLMGIILSGGNEDGSAGLAAIHRSGGVTIVQEPASAQAPLMVLSALKRSPPDFVLPLDEIADLLRTLASTDAVAPLIGPRGG
jgi:two-component system, chemotaxis family, protein-glutamate methylesterase/glutaminase